MSRSLTVALSLLFASLLLPTAPVTPVAAQPPAAAVKVNCHKGESINQNLSKHPDAPSLLVEISGVCRENVVVTRDRVTLRGTDPATDGVEATANVEQTDAAVWVRGAQLVRLENLKLTGGFTGLLATEVGVPFLLMNNCRLEGNVQWGAQLELALLTAEDSTFGPNTRFSVGVFAGSRFECRNCTFTLSPTSTVRDNVVVNISQLLLFNSSLVNGGINGGNAQITAADSSVEAFALPGVAAVLAGGSSAVNLTRTQVEGPLRFFGGTTAQLFGVTQTPGSSPGPTPNFVDDAAFVRVAGAGPFCASPPCAPAPPIQSSVLGFNLSNFSNASLLQNTTVTGNVNCNLGANAVCPATVIVTGTANCGLCVRP